MDENGMENEHSDQKNSSNCEYLPTKCRITKPPPPKPATNPLQFIKVGPPPLFQKAKEQVSQVEKIKKERKVAQDETEDWQANLDNWKSSRRKLQEHIIERVVEVKKFEQDDGGRSRRRCKTFNEILEERGKSKYSIPIYIEEDESNDWSDYGISESKSFNENNDRIDREDQYSSSDEYTHKRNEIAPPIEFSSNFTKINNNYDNPESNSDDVAENGQYTYEGAIEGYRTRIRSKFDDAILVKISDMPKRNSEIETLVPKGEIVKRKQIFDKQQQQQQEQQQIDNNVPNMAARVLQDFENSISIKQRLKCLEQFTNDQSVNNVDNLNIKPKVKEISRIFAKNEQDEEISTNKQPQRREKININIVPWRERETISTPTTACNTEFDQFTNDPKEVESQSDDKSSDTFYSGLEDTNYPPSVSSTDYMVLSSDREDSGIHTADVSCSVSQADDTAEEVESNTNSHETTNDDYQPIKENEDNNNENVPNNDFDSQSHLPEIRDGILKSDIGKNFTNELFDLLNFTSPPMVEDPDTLFNPDFSLLPTKLEPPKEKPPPPPTPVCDGASRMNSTKRIKKEITLKRSNFLGLNEPIDDEPLNNGGITIAVPENEQSKVEEILAKQLYESNLGGSIEESDDYQEINDKALQVKQQTNSEEDEIIKREREIIEMIEEAEKSRFSEGNFEKKSPQQQQIMKPPIPASRTFPPTTNVRKPADASYYAKQPDCSDDQDSEVLKVEQELQQLEQEELKRKRDNLLFRQACSRVFAKNKRYSLENIFDAPPRSIEYRKSMPELQYDEQSSSCPIKNGNFFRSIHEVDPRYRKSVPNIIAFNNNRRQDFQTIDKYDRKSVPEFRHDMHRSAFEIPQRKVVCETKQFIHPGEPIGQKRQNFHPPPLNADIIKPRNNRNVAVLKTRPNAEMKSYDKHWLYQEAELRRLQDQKNFSTSNWQQSKHLPERGPSATSSMSSIRKLTSVGNDIQPYMEHHPLVGPPLTVNTQTRPAAVDESQNRILSVSGKKKCSFCGNELGRGAAMIIETLYLFYHMDCFKCCVCHVQLGNGLNGTDVRVRNQKLHCHNCYSSDDGVKFSCV